MVSAEGGRRRRDEAPVEGFDLYRSRAINNQMRARFPHTLYYALHFDEEAHAFAFAFLGPDGSKDAPDVLRGIEAQTQWNRFVDVMTRDPVISGLRVERIGEYGRIEECVAAARADASDPDDRRKAPPTPEEATLTLANVD